MANINSVSPAARSSRSSRRACSRAVAVGPLLLAIGILRDSGSESSFLLLLSSSLLLTRWRAMPIAIEYTAPAVVDRVEKRTELLERRDGGWRTLHEPLRHWLVR